MPRCPLNIAGFTFRVPGFVVLDHTAITRASTLRKHKIQKSPKNHNKSKQHRHDDWKTLKALAGVVSLNNRVK